MLSLSGHDVLPAILSPAGERLLVQVGPAWEQAQQMASAELGKQPFEQLRKLLSPFAPL